MRSKCSRLLVCRVCPCLGCFEASCVVEVLISCLGLSLV